jgi:hypothetical protein
MSRYIESENGLIFHLRSKLTDTHNYYKKIIIEHAQKHQELLNKIDELEIKLKKHE